MSSPMSTLTGWARKYKEHVGNKINPHGSEPYFTNTNNSSSGSMGTHKKSSLKKSSIRNKNITLITPGGRIPSSLFPATGATAMHRNPTPVLPHLPRSIQREDSPIVGNRRSTSPPTPPTKSPVRQTFTASPDLEDILEEDQDQSSYVPSPISPPGLVRSNIRAVTPPPQQSPTNAGPTHVHPEPLRLNVGGYRFTTTQQTLSAYPSYLSELFFVFRAPHSATTTNLRDAAPNHTAQRPWPEELFIDRDGSTFEHILEFLRNGALPPALPISLLRKLECEARFYGIKPLLQCVTERVTAHLSAPKFKVIPIQSLPQEGVITTPDMSPVSSRNSTPYQPASWEEDCDDSHIRDYFRGFSGVGATDDYSQFLMNSMLGGAGSAKCSEWKPEYEIVQITTIPIFFRKCPEGHGEALRFEDPYVDSVCPAPHVVLEKEMATYVVLRRVDS